MIAEDASNLTSVKLLDQEQWEIAHHSLPAAQMCGDRSRRIIPYRGNCRPSELGPRVAELTKPASPGTMFRSFATHLRKRHLNQGRRGLVSALEQL